MKLSSLFVLSLGGIVASQSLNTLPTCPLTILQSLYSQTGCTDFDFSCLCSDSNFINQAANLINVRCTVAEKIQTFVIVNQLCGFAGISISVPPPSATTTSASSRSSSRSSTSSMTSSSSTSMSSSSTGTSSSASSTSGSSSSSRTASEAASATTGSSATTTSNKGGLSTGAKVGIAVGAVFGFIFLLALIACCVLCFRKRRRRTRSERGLSPESVDHEKSPWGAHDSYPHPSESSFMVRNSGAVGAGVGAGAAVNHMEHPAYRADSLGSERYPRAANPVTGGNSFDRVPPLENHSRPSSHRGEYAAGGAAAGLGAAALASHHPRSSQGSHSGLLHNSHNYSQPTYPRRMSGGSQNGMYNGRASQYGPGAPPIPQRHSQTSLNRSRNSRGTVDYYEDTAEYPR